MADERPVTGRRDNGLLAASWVAVAEVDPRQVSELLATLAAVGIAAYALPSPGLVGGYLERRLPARPVDRLHVDATRRTDAEAVLRAELDGDLLDTARPGTVDSGEAADGAAVDLSLLPDAAASGEPRRGEPDAGPVAQRPAGSTLSAADDAAFAAIVAGWDNPVRTPVNPWPVSEDDEPDPGAPVGPRTPPTVVSSYPVEKVVHRVDDNDHYVPPPPPPAPRIRAQTLIAILAIVVGAAILVGVSVVGPGDNLPLVVGVLSIAAGIVALVAGMRDQDDPDGWDDGAVV